MTSFIVFGVVTLISIAFLLTVSIRYHRSSFLSWLGSLLLIIGSVAYLTVQDTSIMPLFQIDFGVGMILYFVGIYFLSRNINGKANGSPQDDRAKTISDILEVAASRDSLIELLNYSLDRFLEVFSLNSGTIHIFQRSRDILVMGAYRGLIPAHAKRLELIEPGQTAIGKAVQNKRVLIIRDLRVSPDYQFFGGRTEGYSFLAVAPVLVEGECWGVITLMGRRKYTRGMLDVDLLEQFGYKLGQALALGRENRRMRTEFARLELVNDIYNQLCQIAKANLTKSPILTVSDIFRSIGSSRLNLFDNKPFAIIKYMQGSGECLMYRTSRGEIISENYRNVPTLAKRPAAFQPGIAFELRQNELAGLIPQGFFSSGKPACYGYSFRPDISVIVAIDSFDTRVLQRRTSDIMLIGNLLTLAFWAASEIAPKEVEIISKSKDIPEKKELRSLLFNILGEIESIKSQTLTGEENQPGRVMERLRDVESAAMRGIDMIENREESVDPNVIIQSVVEKNHLDVAFYPGLNLKSMPSGGSDFAGVVESILKEAISDNRRIRLKSAQHDGAIALTIEGQLRNEFPSADTVERARRLNIDLNVIRESENAGRAETTSEEAGETSGLRILTIENKPVITELLEDFFDQIGYVNITVGSGKEGLEAIRQATADDNRFDVVIIDMTLDDISGLELCRKIKEFDSAIYRIIISGWGINIHSSTLEDAGVDAVLHKPFRLEQLKKVLPKKGSIDAAENR